MSKMLGVGAGLAVGAGVGTGFDSGASGAKPHMAVVNIISNAAIMPFILSTSGKVYVRAQTEICHKLRGNNILYH